MKSLNKKRLLLIINQLHGGGAQKVIANLSIQLEPMYKVILLIYNDTDKIAFEYAGELIKIKLPYSDDTHSNFIFKRAIRSLSLIKQLRKIKKEKEIDVAISFMEASNIANILSSRNEKTILSVRSYLSNEFKDNRRLKIFKPFIKMLYNKADRIIAPARLVKFDLVNNFRVVEKKISTIYNFIERELIEKNKNQTIESEIENILNNYPVIINVGRITSAKAQWLLPSVLQKVREKNSQAKLFILGEGPLTEKLLGEAHDNGLKVYSYNGQEGLSPLFDIYLLGFKANPYPYLNKSQVFLKSSVYEGFPNVIVEAMACGLPIVSSDCSSGPREILSPDTDISYSTPSTEYAPYGVLTPVYNSTVNNKEEYVISASEAIVELLNNKSRREYYIGQSIKRAVQYDKNTILNQWVNIIENNN